MMTTAYSEIYLRKAMINIADMFDFAINGLGIEGESFSEMFALSTIARRLELGEPKYLIGMCGAEIAADVIAEMTGISPKIDDSEQFLKSPDHWCGWALCYYQWLRAMSYSEIFRIASYKEISTLYKTLHEADVSKFAEVMDARISMLDRETNLKRIRSAYGCSQSQLAAMSGVSLRSIQMYEQRNKDINKSQAITLINLSRALGCRMEDLLEYGSASIRTVQQL